MNIKELQKRVLQINRKVSAGETVRVDLLISRNELAETDNAALSLSAAPEKTQTAATIDVSASGAKAIALKHLSAREAKINLATADVDGSSETIDLNAIEFSKTEVGAKKSLIAKTAHASRATDEIPEVKLTQKDVGKWWILIEECSYTTSGLTLVAPRNFETDLASIPRFFWNIIAPFELSLPAPVFHDLIYKCAGKMVKPKISEPHNFSRKNADDIFLELMIKKNVAVWKRTLAYWAVRGFAEFAWKERL